jgi:3-phosphoglycerate kinase
MVGGGVANNFLKAEGFDISNSYLQDTPADLKKKGVDYVDVAEDLINDSKQERLMIDGYIPLPKIIYPTDVVAAQNLESKSGKVIELVNGERADALKKDLMFLDIGPKTVRLFKEVISQAGTIFWNGPMGVFEKDAFADGTKEIAKAVAKTSATTILGGGDTIAAITKFGLKDRFNHVSTAGGAALTFLAGKELVGITALHKTTKLKK